MKRIEHILSDHIDKIPRQMTPEEMEQIEEWFQSLPEAEREEYSKFLEDAYIKSKFGNQKPYGSDDEVRKTHGLWTINTKPRRAIHARKHEEESWINRLRRAIKRAILLPRIWIDKKTRKHVESFRAKLANWIMPKPPFRAKLANWIMPKPPMYSTKPFENGNHAYFIKKVSQYRMPEGHKHAMHSHDIHGMTIPAAGPTLKENISIEEYRNRIDMALLIDSEVQEESNAYDHLMNPVNLNIPFIGLNQPLNMTPPRQTTEDMIVNHTQNHMQNPAETNPEEANEQ